LADDHEVDSPPTIVVGGSGPVTARLLCGRLKTNWPGGVHRMALPPVIKLADDAVGSDAAALRVRKFETYTSGSGAAPMLTRAASLILADALRVHPQCPAIFRYASAPDPVAHAMQLIRAEPSTGWTVASLAQRVGMGRSSFAAKFTAE